MRKLLLSLTVLCLILASCGGNHPAPTSGETEKGYQKEEKCCKGMTEYQKQECIEFKAKWDDWANLTDEVKQQLIEKKKACFDKKMDEMRECESKMQERKVAVEEKLANWINMTLDEQKAFFDDFGNCCIKVKESCCKPKGGCCAKKEREVCPKKHEGCAQKTE